ncbi:MAG: UTP--glucose-1-phosphate uridylyltransferase GalU [bacterium]|nr:UTP--glucose-1-phosphate uridylyltransferase GalU [bacterium]
MSERIRKAVIPAAGFGTRFLPATKATPKEMFPLVDKPLAQYVVEEAAAAGIEEIIFVTGQAKRAIEDHFDRNFELEYLLHKSGKDESLAAVRDISNLVSFAYVRQKEMKGLGHAVLQTKNLLNHEPFAVILPDNVFSGAGPALGDVIKVYEQVGTSVVGVKEVPREQTGLYGIVSGEPSDETTDADSLKVTGIVEKPDPADAPTRQAAIGRYVLTPGIFGALENLKPDAGGEIQLAGAIHDLAKMESVYTATVSGEYHDAGDKLGYLQAVVEYTLARDDLGPTFREYLKKRLSSGND